ncbi:RNA polymerase sigma factor [Marinilabiliaceae bacterium JC017]|nr:RNA polymerase sigma factor [Marinilabiliaceae bacterium JC017]
MSKDLELVNKVKSGNTAMFYDLVNIYQKQVVNTCYSFVNHKEDAEDVAQEVFVEVYRSINKFREESSFSTWLYRLSVNKSLDFIRARNRQKRGSGLLSFWSGGELERLNVVSLDQPGEVLESEERRTILLAAINKLPERQKVAITLSKLEELSQEEVAEVMQTSVSSVESLLVRAKKRLRILLYGFFSEKYER